MFAICAYSQAMLVRKDYFVRYIEMFGDYLARLARGERDAALEKAVVDALDLTLEQLEDLSETWLRSRLLAHEEMDHWRAFLTSELALAVGNVRLGEGRPLAAAFMFERAVTLLDWSGSGDLSALSSRVDAHVDALGRALRQADVTTAQLVKLMGMAEQQGRLAAAEDLLFALARRGWAEAHQYAEAFYRRLGKLDERTLVAGGLSREDLSEGPTDLGVLESPGEG